MAIEHANDVSGYLELAGALDEISAQVQAASRGVRESAPDEGSIIRAPEMRIRLGRDGLRHKDRVGQSTEVTVWNGELWMSFKMTVREGKPE